MKSLYFLTIFKACLSVYLIAIFITSNKLYMNTAQWIICFLSDEDQSPTKNLEMFWSICKFCITDSTFLCINEMYEGCVRIFKLDWKYYKIHPFTAGVYKTSIHHLTFRKWFQISSFFVFQFDESIKTNLDQSLRNHIWSIIANIVNVFNFLLVLKIFYIIGSASQM